MGRPAGGAGEEAIDHCHASICEGNFAARTDEF